MVGASLAGASTCRQTTATAADEVPWRSMPHNQLAKCRGASGRGGVFAVLAKIYTPEEMMGRQPRACTEAAPRKPTLCCCKRASSRTTGARTKTSAIASMRRRRSRRFGHVVCCNEGRAVEVAHEGAVRPDQAGVREEEGFQPTPPSSKPAGKTTDRRTKRTRRRLRPWRPSLDE